MVATTNKRNGAIGIFDSGFGGLNIMREIVKELPDYDFVYLGDTARAPYGNRSSEVIYHFAKEASNFLFQNNCHLVIFACNTASSDALRRIQQEYVTSLFPDKKVLGVVVPGAEAAVAKTKNKKIGVMATEATVASGAFEREIKKLDFKIKIYQQACSLLVPIVEAGEQNSRLADMALENYLKPLLTKNIDTLILGCTHYGLLENKIKKLIGPEVKLISEAKVVSIKLKEYLGRHPEVEKRLSKKHKRTFFSTDLTPKFAILGSQFYGQKITVNKAVLN